MKSSRLLGVSFPLGLIAVSIAVGTRAQGAYVYLLVLSILGLIWVLKCSPSPVCSAISAGAKPSVVLLVGFIMSLILSGFLKGGVLGLKESISLYLSIPFLFVAGILIPALSPKLRFRCYNNVVIPLTISLIFSGLVYALSNAHYPISSLRPSEFVLVTGITASTLVARDLIGIAAKSCLPSYNLRLAILFAVSCLFGASIIFVGYLFRGVISGSILIGSCLLLLLSLANSRAQAWILLIFWAAGASLLLLLSPLARFAVLKIMVTSFTSGEGFSSRLHLFDQGMAILSENTYRIPLFGPVNPNVADFWAHNTFLDLFIHDGMVPVILFSAFVISYAVSIIRVCRTIEVLLNFCLLPAILLMGALLQPVQYSDGISYSLSYACLGFSLGLALRSHASPLLGNKS